MFEVRAVMIVRKPGGGTAHHVEGISIFFVRAIGADRRFGGIPGICVPHAEVVAEFVPNGAAGEAALNPCALGTDVTLAGPAEPDVRKDDEIEVEKIRI